jgi:hypothetical protein
LLGKLSPPGSPGTGTNRSSSSRVDRVIGRQHDLEARGQPAAEIDLGPEGGAFSLAARLDVSLPGMERAMAQRLVEQATKPKDEVNADLLVIAPGTGARGKRVPEIQERTLSRTDRFGSWLCENAGARRRRRMRFSKRLSFSQRER